MNFKIFVKLDQTVDVLVHLFLFIYIFVLVRKKNLGETLNLFYPFFK